MSFKVFILSFFISVSAFASAGFDICHQPQAPQILQKKLTPFWGQEYIGADLVRAELLELTDSHSLKKVNVAIFDIGFEKKYISLTENIRVPPQRNGERTMRAHHGTSVANLLNGPTPYGVAEHLNLIMLGAASVASMYNYFFLQFEKNKRYPKIISNSVGWGHANIADVALRADERDILWFLAAGNSYPKPVKKIEIESKALVVGSFAPSGLQSFDSQSDNDLLILAPGNEELATINGYGKRHLFGATSGATPLVAGSMANISVLLPSINREQTKRLLKKSSFQSAENILGDFNAPSLLNAYRAFHVAKRIYDNCPLENQKSCIDHFLKIDSSYQFPKRKRVSCREFKKAACQQQNKLLTKMRKSALLGDDEQLLELSCAYEHLGYQKNAEFYKFLGSHSLDLEEMEKSAVTAIKAGLHTISYYRYLTHYSSKVKNLLLEKDGALKKHRIKQLLDLF